MKKSYFKTALIFIAIIGFFVSANAIAAPKKLVIGHPACLSGKYAKAGEQAIGGIKACVDWVNNVYAGVLVGKKRIPLKYKYYDCESKKESVTSLIGRLITVDKVNVVFSAYSSGLTLRGAPVAESHKMLYMDHGGANNKIFRQGFRYIVQTIGPATRYHEGTLNMIHKIDPTAKKVALAYEDSEFAKMVMHGAEKHAKKLGFNVVFERTYPKGVTDLTPLLSALKASNPDFILGGGHFEDGQLFNRQMADLGINSNALSLIAAATLPAFYKALTSMAEGVMGPSHWEYGVKYSAQEAKKVKLPWIGPSQDEFVALFKKALGKNIIPDYHAAEAAAQVLAYVLAVEKANSIDSDKVRAALGDLTFMSFYGGWDVDETGLQVGHSMVDVQWQDGKRVIVWPEEAQTGKPCYPMPTFAEKAKGKVAVPK
ncbi:MAG: branched-chain amino acid ABC transporter substrate-binding protein [Deltaproteobacteria bacterium]|nr:amino acid ABC transporter substrate-binding protein [Deltaproteobacteria bacterium]MCD6264891.1 amino acid ABC transporter substrate-binding protein [Deltaproteobacteria bacterium]RLB14850.1 MAG: branched-chain amino acid ABC transporter substrate-binding protein [Deltaproteobacteria bacterium]RLB22560.1 MAG: branched-chain amino acid ABC transporter substrate-binding protein [Deltaproteobacteria bacterium]HDH86559.1 branched-chain amino acid ABC transporter substrate-binding protein [Desul